MGACVRGWVRGWVGGWTGGEAKLLGHLCLSDDIAACAPAACAHPQVFTTAASDESPQIVRLAFDTVEKIVREHFNHITGKRNGGGEGVDV